MNLKRYFLSVLIGYLASCWPSFGLASVVDTFDCDFSWTSELPEESFSFSNQTSVVRTLAEYPHIRGHNPRVMESKVSFKSLEKSHDVQFSATLMFRYATDVGAVGRAMDAALWTCGDFEILTPNKRIQKSCSDADVKTNPFDRKNVRWIPTGFKSEQVEFPRDFEENIEFPAADVGLMAAGVLRLTCKHKDTMYN
ncbi:MAG: hypothetical protein RIR26_181 [Pseudomonadota bacterium]|jgi:hypothetical protein